VQRPLQCLLSLTRGTFGGGPSWGLGPPGGLGAGPGGRRSLARGVFPGIEYCDERVFAVGAWGGWVGGPPWSRGAVRMPGGGRRWRRGKGGPRSEGWFPPNMELYPDMEVEGLPHRHRVRKRAPRAHGGARLSGKWLILSCCDDSCPCTADFLGDGSGAAGLAPTGLKWSGGGGRMGRWLLWAESVRAMERSPICVRQGGSKGDTSTVLCVCPLARLPAWPLVCPLAWMLEGSGLPSSLTGLTLTLIGLNWRGQGSRAASRGRGVGVGATGGSLGASPVGIHRMPVVIPSLGALVGVSVVALAVGLAVLAVVLRRGFNSGGSPKWSARASAEGSGGGASARLPRSSPD
jgi:hypothetical protein